MYYQYGYFKPLVVRKVGGVMTLRQLAPPLLVLCLAATALAALLGLALLPIGWKLVAPTAFALVAGGYLAAIGACRRRRRPPPWLGRGSRARGGLPRLALELWDRLLAGSRRVPAAPPQSRGRRGRSPDALIFQFAICN